MVESGPASGFWGAAELGKLIGEPNVLALDIGGTTAKCSLIEDGQVKIMTDYWIERDRTSAGYPIMVPVVDLVEIGNGGGSIAWVDDFGKLHVGPQSAGAVPGPAAYGRAARRPRPPTPISGSAASTATISAAARSRPTWRLPTRRSRRSARSSASTPDEAARGIIRIANNNMVNALKLVSLNRGHDPRDFTLVAFGGGGAMHAVALAGELGVKKVVVPAGAAVFSAWGMMMSDLRRDYFVTRLADLKPGSADGIEALFAETEARAHEAVRGRGRRPATRSRSCATASSATRTRSIRPRCCSTDGAITDDRLSARSRPRSTRPTSANTPTGWTRRSRWSASTSSPRPKSASSTMAKPDADGPKTPGRRSRARREVDYASKASTRRAIYDGEKLEPGMTFAGPAIVEDPGTTVVIHPGNRCRDRRLRQHPHHTAALRGATMNATQTTRSRWKSSRTRCRRPPTRCSPPCGRRR